jgi:hypothetical protein
VRKGTRGGVGVLKWPLGLLVINVSQELGWGSISRREGN